MPYRTSRTTTSGHDQPVDALGPQPVDAPTAAAAGPTDLTTATPTAAGAAGPEPAVVAPAEALEPPTFALSIKQLLASAAAAVTAAVLGSRLGVAGTLIGAGLASSVSMVAAAVYSHSLASAAYRVKVARIHADTAAEAPTQAFPAAQRAWGQVPAVQSATVAPPVRSAPVPRVPQAWRSHWVAAGLGVVAACALALLTVTGIEAVRGAPLSGGTAGGLSILGGASVGTPDSSGTTGRTTEPADRGSTDPGSSDPESSPDVVTPSSSADVTTTTVTTTATVTPTGPPTSSSAPSAPSTGGSSTGGSSTATPSTGTTPSSSNEPTAPSTSGTGATDSGSTTSTTPAAVPPVAQAPSPVN